MYYFYFCTIMTILEALCEKYTNIIKYIHWTWYLTWITFFITFFISRNYYLWFFRLRDTKQDLSCLPSESEKHP
ncbi:MAG TPA: CBO0543 family protein [Desulfosporosinus sp.]